MRILALTTAALSLALAACQEDDTVAAKKGGAEAPVPSTAPEGMVWIPKGKFTMGIDEAAAKSGELPVRSGAEEWPPHQVILAGFWMDATEVTNEQFKAFVDATGYLTQAERPFKQEDYPNADPKDLEPAAFVLAQPKEKVDASIASHWTWWKLTPGADWKHPDGPGSDLEGKDDHPVVNLAYEDALAYAKWAGKRLPTEAEWEYAARGGLADALYPWGNDLQPDGKWLANIWQGEFPNENTEEDGFMTTSPVKAYPANGYGLFDMAGNVWEIVGDDYEQGYYSRSPVEAPVGGEGESIVPGKDVKQRIIRGGSFLCSVGYCTGYRVAARQLSDDISASHHTGFRCVKDVE
jgi:formylglycine-generating enzyme required for sulfatase activity